MCCCETCCFCMDEVRSVCNIITGVILIICGIFVGGYVGKYLDLQYGTNPATHNLNWKQIVFKDDFWALDGWFWIYGIFTVMVIFISATILRRFWIFIMNIIKLLLYTFLCCCFYGHHCGIERPSIHCGDLPCAIHRNDRHNANDRQGRIDQKFEEEDYEENSDQAARRKALETWVV